MTDLQPGTDLDRLFAERVEGYHWDESRCRVCGWLLGCGLEAYCTPENCCQRPAPRHRADGVAPVSTDSAIALAALERFAEKRGATWTITRAQPDLQGISSYCVTLHDGVMPPALHWATTIAHAMVLALLAAMEVR